MCARLGAWLRRDEQNHSQCCQGRCRCVVERERDVTDAAAYGDVIETRGERFLVSFSHVKLSFKTFKQNIVRRKESCAGSTANERFAGCAFFFRIMLVIPFLYLLVVFFFSLSLQYHD